MNAPLQVFHWWCAVSSPAIQLRPLPRGQTRTRSNPGGDRTMWIARNVMCICGLAGHTPSPIALPTAPSYGSGVNIPGSSHRIWSPIPGGQVRKDLPIRAQTKVSPCVSSPKCIRRRSSSPIDGWPIRASLPRMKTAGPAAWMVFPNTSPGTAETIPVCAESKGARQPKAIMQLIQHNGPIA